MRPTDVIDSDGQLVGTYRRSFDTPYGEMLLISREEQLGGGDILVLARDAEGTDGAWRLALGGLSVLEAPPYSPNVDLYAYFQFWERLGIGNVFGSASEYMPTGSGPVHSDVDTPDIILHDAVTNELRVAEGVHCDQVRVSVKRGTVLLEGYQMDTRARLAAAKAAASVPGVKEVVNMLVIRAL